MSEPRKTPRTDAAELPWVANTQVACYGPCVKSDFARALEIETQELDEALEAVTHWAETIEVVHAHPFLNNGPVVRARAALARHRAKQEAAR